MRRSIMVFGCTMEDGSQVTCDDDGVVSVRVHPDHSVTVTNSSNDETAVDGKWVGYVPRFN
jgi:hypothetical protein